LAHPGASARAGVLAAHGRGRRRGRGERRRHCGPTRQRERRGKMASLFDGAGEPAERGGGGSRPPVAQFLVHGEVA
jgi:hypothetical protein